MPFPRLRSEKKQHCSKAMEIPPQPNMVMPWMTADMESKTCGDPAVWLSSRFLSHVALLTVCLSLCFCCGYILSMTWRVCTHNRNTTDCACLTGMMQAVEEGGGLRFFFRLVMRWSRGTSCPCFSVNLFCKYRYVYIYIHTLVVWACI